MSESESAEFHEMREPTIEKVVVHMGVGEGGRALADAEDIIESITGQQSVRTKAKSTMPDFGIRQGDPIGVKVTLRGTDAEEFLGTALPLVELSTSQFDETGNFSFGVDEHTDFPGQDYNPNVGIYGLDVTVNLVRPGYRVTKRNKRSQSLPSKHRLNPADAVGFIESAFDAEVTHE